jgi:hypothetical protein
VIEFKFGRERFHEAQEMSLWLIDHYGRGMWYRHAMVENNDCRWAQESAFGITWFYFRNQEDATMFALRWA